jgi:hypothetical protein
MVVPDYDDVAPVVIENGPKKRKRSYILIGGLCAFFLAGATALTLAFAETTITVHPVARQPQINADFEAFKEPRDGALTFTVMPLEATKERQVKATGEKLVQEQARGIIEIYKTTPGAERLIKNTRFRSPDGLIFRIQESVVVPGAVEKDGTLVPGSIRADVFAEAIGENYNLAANTRFTIPGFSESGLTDLFNAMYATNPQPFTGGFDGPQFILDDTELNTARQQLQIDLRNELLGQVNEKRPAGFVTFSGAYSFTYSQLPPVSFGDDLVTIREQAVLHVPLFNESELASFLARQAVPSYNGNPVRIEGYDQMLFSYKNPDHAASVLADLPSLAFSLVGRPLIVWEYDENRLRQDLAGKSRSEANQVQESYRGSIERMVVSVKPFYRRSFPSNPEEIKLIEVVEVPD